MRHVIVLALVLIASTASADSFKCQKRDGRTYVSDLPCEKGDVIEKIQPSESVADPAAAQRELERQRAVANQQGTENDMARSRPARVGSLPDYGSPPPPSQTLNLPSSGILDR